MRCKRVEEHREDGEFCFIDGALFRNNVHERHQRCNGGVELEVLNVIRDLLDGFVERIFHLRADRFAVDENGLQVPITLNEAAAALDAGVAPRCGLLKVADEHFVETERICAELVYNVIRVDNVAAGLTHLLAVFTEDHAVACALCIRFCGRDLADVVEELMPETAVQQVQRGVLHAAVIPVYLMPVVECFLGCKRFIVVRIHIAQEVPGGACPLRHGVRFAHGLAAALRARGVDPIGHLRERRFAVIGRLVGINLRQNERQLAFIDRHIAALLAVYNRNRLAPVALACEYPVTELIVDLTVADAGLLKVIFDADFRFFDGHAVQNAGVDHDAGVAVRERFFLHIAALNDFDDWQVELLCELPVTGIVCRNSHDGAGTVGNENIVGNEDRNGGTGQRIDGLNALQTHAGLIFRDLGALKVGLFRGLCLIRADGIQILQLIRPLFNERVLRGNDHVRCAVKCIRAGRVNSQLIACGCVEIDLGALGTANPVFLLGLNAVWIIDKIKVVDEALCVSGDFQHPLGFDLVNNFTAAALTDAVDNLFVCQNAFAGGAPVDGHLFFVGQTVLKELEENPLRPLVVFRINGADLTAPVEGDAERLNLLLKARNILLCDLFRVHVILDGIILCR